MSTQKNITILGSTGSIGISTLDVVARHGDMFRVAALTAYSQTERLFEQCCQYKPDRVVMVKKDAAQQLEEKIRKHGLETEVLHGEEALCRIAGAEDSDTVMAAIVGAAGLLPTLEAVKSGKRVLLANKEPLVMCGELFLEAAENSGALMLPIDSEHNAIFQCMPPGFRTGQRPKGLKRILLTGSGGPFRGMTRGAMGDLTPEQACAHPNWDMGKKISVDSATLMNKGLEVIEACRLFGVTAEDIEVIIHPQSVIHSMVEYKDGSVLAQLGMPDMRTPIANALAWPERVESGVKSLDLLEVSQLHFEEPDTDSFPCLRLAYEAAKTGGTAPAVLNAANEEAVSAFLQERLNFNDIPLVIEETLSEIATVSELALEHVLEADRIARETVLIHINKKEPLIGAVGK